MPAKYPEIRTFSGLHVQANSFNVPDGAMEVAENIYFPSDDIISKIPGFYTYDQLDTGFAIDWQTKYQGFPVVFAVDGSGIGRVYTYPIAIFVDDFNAVSDGAIASGEDPGYVYGNSEQNKNLYFAGENGVFKLETYSPAVVYKAGIPPALDISGSVGPANAGPLQPFSVVGYRYVFGRRDGNNNQADGSPSDIFYVSMPQQGVGVTFTSVGAGPYTVTVTFTGHGLRTGDVILVSNGTPSSAVNGSRTVTVLNANQFTFSTAANPSNGTLDYGFTRTARLECKIPSEIDDANLGFYIQIHRTKGSASDSAAPEPNFALIEEHILTAAEVTLGLVFYVDELDFGLEGALLYTNPNSREGEDQANGRPPKCKDIALYKNCSLYFNIETRHRLFAQLFDSPANITFSGIGATENYVPVTTGYGNQTVDATAAGVGTITITTPAAHGFSTGWQIIAANITGSLPAGRYTITVLSGTTFTISSPGNTASVLTIEAVTNGTDAIFWSDTTTLSIAAQIANTAQALVRAINRQSLVYYANYVSTFDGPSGAPGQIRIETKDFSDTPFVMNPTGSNPFLQAMPATSLNDKYEDGIMASKPGQPEAVPVGNLLRVGDPSAGILRGFLNRDSTVIVKEEGFYRLSGDILRNFQISAIDSTFVPISRKSWCSINNTLIGLTDQGLAVVTESSAQILSRRIDDMILPLVGYGSQSEAFEFNAAVSSEHTGLYYVTLWGEVGETLASRTAQPIRTIVYNVKNKTFSTCTELLLSGTAVGSELYIADQTREGVIKKQHNFGNLADFTGEFRQLTALANASQTTATITLSTVISPPTYSLDVIPEPGDAIIYGSAISKITEVEALGGDDYLLTFSTKTNIPFSGSPVDAFFYKGITSRFTMAPYHAGQVSLSKQFSILQLHMRQPGVSKAVLEFSSCYFEGSELTPWALGVVDENSGGWGSGPWGLFPWGLQAGIGFNPGTLASAIVRIYLPRASQRGTYVKCKFTHSEACEALLLQALAYAARGYGERVSR